MSPQQDAPLYHDLVNGRDVSQPNNYTVLRDKLDDFNEWREKQDTGALLNAAKGDIKKTMRMLVAAFNNRKEDRQMEIENKQQPKASEPEI